MSLEFLKIQENPSLEGFEGKKRLQSIHNSVFRFIIAEKVYHSDNVNNYRCPALRRTNIYSPYDKKIIIPIQSSVSSVVTFFGFIKSRITKEFPTLWPKMDKAPSHHFLLQDAIFAHISAEDLSYKSNK